jgi:alpha-mannosidase
MPSWRDLRRFCERDEWELYKDTDHYYFRKFMQDGTLKRTKVSKSSKEIPAKLWKFILQHQLKVDETYFNRRK